MTNYQKIYQLFYRKRVVIVGGQNSALLNSRDYPGYDLVVRMNNHWFNQLGKCDVVFHDCSFDFHSYEINPLLMVGNMSQGYFQEMRSYCQKYSILSDGYSSFQYLNGSPFGPECEWANSFVKRYQMRPFTGHFAIEYIRRFAVSEIYLTGMTLYHDSVNPVKKENFIRDSHDIKKSLDHLLYVTHEDARIKTDKTLDKILELYR